jgi:hypothetical protein
VSKRGDKTGVTHMVHLKKLISDDETAGEKDLKHVTVSVRDYRPHAVCWYFFFLTTRVKNQIMTKC